MNLQLITLGGIKLNDEVYEVVIPTSEGEIGVFPGHEPLVTVAVPGVISVRRSQYDDNQHLELFAISGGVVEVSQESVRILVDEADSDEDIAEDESRAALERALRLRDEATDQVELERAHQLVDRHSVRLKVAELRRQRHR